MANPAFRISLPFAILVLSIFITSSLTANTSNGYEGEWQINSEATEALREPYKDNSNRKKSRFRSQMSVGGIPMPRSGGQRSMSQLTAQNPMVLRSSEMAISFKEDGEIHISYIGLGEEILRKGEYRGRKTKWSAKGIKQTYKTTERRVTKIWSLNKQGQLLVEVKIKPNESKQFVTRVVFDRKSV